MKSWIRLFSPAGNIDSLLAAIAGFCIIHVFTLHSGVGISPDSVAYLSVARNLHSGAGLIAYDRMPLVQFPVLYPFFLEAILFFTHLDPVVFAPLMNGILFALLIYISGSLMKEFSFQSSWYKRILLSCIVLSPCLLEIYSMLWSETLFMIFSLLFIASFYFAYRSRSLGSLLVLSLITALACLTRYAGVSLIGAGGLLLLMDSRLSWPKRILRISIFSVVSYSLMAINLVRNTMVSGTMTGIRQKGTTPLARNLYYFGSTLCDWLPLSKGHYYLSLFAALLCIGILGFLFLQTIPARPYSISPENIAVVFAIVYCVFIILSSTITRYQQLDSRLLSPLFIPLIWGLSYWIPALVKKIPRRRRIWLICIALAAAVAFQSNQLISDYETYDGVKDAGVPGYMEDPWPQSATVNFLKNNTSLFRAGYAIYSNAGDAVYFFSGLSCDLLPEKVFPEEVKMFYDEEDHYLVWFNDIDNPDMISLKDILDHKKMTCIRQLNDGAVYLYDKN